MLGAHGDDSGYDLLDLHAAGRSKPGGEVVFTEGLEAGCLRRVRFDWSVSGSAYQWGAAGIFRDEVGELTADRVLALARRLVEFALISKPPWPVGP